MVRRIDSLYCTRQNGREKTQAIIDDLNSNADVAKKAVTSGIGEVVELLKQRQHALTAEIDDILKDKTKKLTRQLDQIEKGTCQPAMPEEPDGDVDSNCFLLCTDGVVNFKSEMEELKKTIETFGNIDVASTYASQSYARGPLIDAEMKINNQAWLLVYARDLHGAQRSQGGEKLTVSLDSPDLFGYEIEDTKDGKYRLCVTAQAEGTYNLHIGFEADEADEAIRGAPFTIRVLPPRNYTVIGADTLGEAGKPWVTDEVGQLRRPSGLRFDPIGRYVFVADQCNDRLQVFDVNSKNPLCAFGKKGPGQQEFNSPGFIVVDRENRVIVTDILNHRIQVLLFNPKAASLWHVRSVGSHGEGPGEFQFPRGVALTEQGLLLVCDTGNHRMQVFDSTDDFKFIREFGEPGNGEGEFKSPLDVAVNRSGEILVSDECHRIQVFDSNGVYLRTLVHKKGSKEGMLKHPMSIAVDDEDALFVCDQGNHRVQVFNASTGQFIHKWGGTKKKLEADSQDDPPTDGRTSPEAPEPDKWQGLVGPAGITVSAAGVILVSDNEKHIIYDY